MDVNKEHLLPSNIMSSSRLWQKFIFALLGQSVSLSRGYCNATPQKQSTGLFLSVVPTQARAFESRIIFAT